MTGSATIRGKRILVLGGAGFIGSHLVDNLLERGDEVTVVDPCFSETGGRLQNLAHSIQKIDFIQRRIEDINSLDEFLEPFHTVIDAMGFTSHHESLKNPRRDLEMNYSNHLALLEALLKTPRPLIYLGSRSQYGKLSSDTNETSVAQPLDPQGVHKMAAESLFRLYAETKRFAFLSVRLGNCYGPRQNSRSNDIGFVGSIVKRLLMKEEVEIYGDGDRSRQLLFIEDLCRTILKLISQMNEGVSVLNFAGPVVRMQDLMDALSRVIPGARYRFSPFPEEIRRMEPGDGILNQRRLEERLGSVDFSPLSLCVQKTVSYFRQEYNL